MKNNLKFLQQITPILAKLVDGNQLTSDESKQAFTNTFLYDTEGIHSAILMAALHAKGETADELYGLCLTYKDLATMLNPKLNQDKMIDLSGTGGGSFKTINVSTAASFVVAAAGYTVGKAAYYGITSPTGSADVFAAFGIDISKLTKDSIEQTLEKVNICPFFLPFISPKLANRGKISRKIFGELQLKIRSPFHLATNAFSPLPMTHRIYGCYSEKYLEVLAQLFAKLGFKKSLTFYGEIGVPEISNVGKTIVVEQTGNNFKKYILTPGELGIKEAKPKDIKTGDKDQNIMDFIAVLNGQDNGAKSDLVALNAGAALYVLGNRTTIKDGVKKAKEILASGKSYSILEKLTRMLGSETVLKTWSEKVV